MRIFILIICNLLLFNSLIISQPNSLYPKNEKGLWGYVNNKSKVKIRYQYVQAEPFIDGIALVREIYSFTPYYFIAVTGKKVFPESYSYARSFSEGLALVKNGNYGYLNTEGKLAIPFKYPIAEDFSDGFAVVGKDNPSVSAYGEVSSIYAIINKNDNLLGNRWFSSVIRNSTDTFIVTINNEKYALFSNGEMVLKENKVVNYTDTSTEFYRLLTYKKEVIEDMEFDTTEVLGDTIDFYKVEIKPEFPGGESAMMQWICQNVKYPDIAKENGVQGKVFVQFVVDKSGKVTKVEILRGVDPNLDQEAIRVISSMPKWTPGKKNGKKVNVSFQFPINFKLYY